MNVVILTFTFRNTINNTNANAVQDDDNAIKIFFFILSNYLFQD